MASSDAGGAVEGCPPRAVILAGGYGSRLSEETDRKPKPMVEIGGKPLLWHIMKIYSNFGIDEFVICLGYRGYLIKEYFANYHLHAGDVTFDLADGAREIHQSYAEPWKVTLIDTGEGTMTGGRLKRVLSMLEGERDFCFTYGDGVADVDLDALIAFHRSHNALATVTAVQPPSRFGVLELDGSRIQTVREKPADDVAWINGGFFVLSPRVVDYIDGDATTWEDGPMQRLAQDGELSAYRHRGFWHAVDTLRDLRQLQELWDSGAAPWKTWR